MDFGTQFVGKKVVITGAAGVFGKWIAEAFAKVGADLWLSDIREAELQKLAQSPALQSVTCYTHRTDLTDAASIRDLADRIREVWGAPDILINNAAIYRRNELLKMSLEEWNEAMDVNVTAPFLLTQLLANQMIAEGKKGSIINMSSGAAVNTQIGGGYYSTGKAALAMLTRAFALELAPYNIRVNSVGPGFAPGSEVSTLSPEYIQNMISTIPLGRTSGPNDAPMAILFLCSEQASFITGAMLAVDGGRTAGTYKAPK